MLLVDVASPAMPAKKRDETEQVGLRLNRAQLMRLRQHANEHLLKPTLTQLIDGAIAEYLARHADDRGTEITKPHRNKAK